MLGRMMCGFMVLCAISAPVIAAETADREKSPYFDSDTVVPLERPLPSILAPGGNALRLTYRVGGMGPEGNFIYIVETNSDGRHAKITFDKKWVRYVLGMRFPKQSKGVRELTEEETAAFLVAFKKIKICSTPAEGGHGSHLDDVYIEFANDTRHCFAERGVPDFQNYALEFHDMHQLMASFTLR